MPDGHVDIPQVVVYSCPDIEPPVSGDDSRVRLGCSQHLRAWSHQTSCDDGRSFRAQVEIQAPGYHGETYAMVTSDTGHTIVDWHRSCPGCSTYNAVVPSTYDRYKPVKIPQTGTKQQKDKCKERPGQHTVLRCLRSCICRRPGSHTSGGEVRTGICERFRLFFVVLTIRRAGQRNRS